MVVTISRKNKNLANKKSGILDKSGRFSSMIYCIVLSLLNSILSLTCLFQSGFYLLNIYF